MASDPKIIDLAGGGPPVPPLQLALRADDAAAALSISRGLLEQQAKLGLIPHMRVGRAVLYPVSGLQRWLDEQCKKGATP